MPESFLEKPNLPDRPVTCVIAGEGYAGELRRALSPLGIRVVACPENPVPDPRLASHADLSAIHLGGKKLLVSDKVCRPDFIRELESLGAEIVPASSPAGSVYPGDCGLCALIAGEMLFHHQKHTDRLLRDGGAYGFVHVNQGYAKCAVCPISAAAAITSDSGVAAIMAARGFDVLSVSAGEIELDGYAHGFFGGSAFLISGDRLAFTGNLDNIRDRERILSFLQKHGIEPVFLTDRPVFDIGSAIPLLQQSQQPAVALGLHLLPGHKA